MGMKVVVRGWCSMCRACVIAGMRMPVGIHEVPGDSGWDFRISPVH